MNHKVLIINLHPDNMQHFIRVMNETINKQTFMTEYMFSTNSLNFKDDCRHYHTCTMKRVVWRSVWRVEYQHIDSKIDFLYIFFFTFVIEMHGSTAR